MIHREGYKISLIVFLVLAVLNILVFLFTGPAPAAWTVSAASAAFMVFVLRFFMDPERKATFSADRIYAPADGKVVAVEETLEEEYLKDRRIQVSIFMSVWNVHVNWFTVGGTVTYYRYHPGKYLVARHPKSSLLNERNTTVIKTKRDDEILVRQIAGTIARRIVSYALKGRKVSAGDELGFIRFGSRVDVFLPPDCIVLVRPGQKVRGLHTSLAQFK
jgi:phosphatidylserine decarboxylase